MPEAPVTADLVINMYLYGMFTPPTDLAADNLLRPGGGLPHP